MLCVRRLIVMDWPETSVTDAALAAHCTQPRTVLAPQLAVGITRIAYAAHLLLHGLAVKEKPAQICAGWMLPMSLRYSPGPFQGWGICRKGRV